MGVAVFSMSVSRIPVRRTVWKAGPWSVVSSPPSTGPRGVGNVTRLRTRSTWPSTPTSDSGLVPRVVVQEDEAVALGHRPGAQARPGRDLLRVGHVEAAAARRVEEPVVERAA